MTAAPEARVPSLADRAFLRTPIATVAFRERQRAMAERTWIVRHGSCFVILGREAGELLLRAPTTAFPGFVLGDLAAERSTPVPPLTRAIMAAKRPHHAWLRSVIAPAMTVRAAERARAAARDQIVELCAALPPGEELDFVSAVARPYGWRVAAAAVLGVAPEEADGLRRGCAGYDHERTPPAARAGHPGYAWLSDNVRQLAMARRREPRPDVLSSLANAMRSGTRLPDEDCVDDAIDVFVAGAEGIGHQLSHGVLLVAGAAGRWPSLAGSPGRIGQLVAETLAEVPLSPFIPRVLLERIGHRGVSLAAGSLVLVCAASPRGQHAGAAGDAAGGAGGSRCPQLAFGRGRSSCLGANLARMALQEAWGGLLTRFADVTLAGRPAFEVVVGRHRVMRLPVCFSGSPPG